MTDTVISSATREVTIGFDRPFAVIGERINPTGRRRLAEEMAAGDYRRVEADAVAQVRAGAHLLDVNAGVPLADEPRILRECVTLVQSLTDTPLSIDSSIVAALEAGLAAYDGKALVNSVTGEDERLESVLPLVARHGAAVVAISNDETGISEDPDVRFEVARKIVERAEDHGIPRRDVVVDPLVMPIGAIGAAGRTSFRLIRRLREELRVNTTCGASQHLLRASRPARPQRRVSRDGDDERPHLRHHQPARARDHDRPRGGGRHDGPRPQLPDLDLPSFGHGRGCGRRGACPPPAGSPARWLTTPSSSSPLPGGAAAFRPGRRSSRRRGGSGSTSTRCAGDAASAPAARCG